MRFIDMVRTLAGALRLRVTARWSEVIYIYCLAPAWGFEGRVRVYTLMIQGIIYAFKAGAFFLQCVFPSTYDVIQ